MEGDFIKINEWLTPLSWLYGLGVSVRNWMYDIGLRRQRAFSLPVISVGNLTVGGCGKTPHVEYLVRLLKDQYRVAVLSRGYKRKSRGFMVATEETTMPEIGDEPFQMKQKFPDVTVAVDKKRCHGIDQLLAAEDTKDTEVVLLDDAFQHRSIKPGLNILLVDYHRLIIYDKLLPAGRLREPRSGKERADVVIVTKCPSTLKPMDYRVLTKAMSLRPYQKLYFTSIAYGDMEQHFGQAKRPLASIQDDEHVLVVSGIASPEQITVDLAPFCKNIEVMAFADHYQYNRNDIKRIWSKFQSLPEPRIIITTEKDAARLSHLDSLPEEMKKSIYILPITIEFKQGQQQLFDERLVGYVKNAIAMKNINRQK